MSLEDVDIANTVGTKSNNSSSPGRVKLHDFRSRSFAYPVKIPEVGLSVLHRLDAPHVDQFYTSGCVGFSGDNFLNTRYAKNSRKAFNKIQEALSGNDRYPFEYLDHDDGLVNYSGATVFDPFDWVYPPTDEGSSGLGLAKFWLDLGIIQRYEWTFGFEHFLAALQKQPVSVGTWWYEGMTDPDEKGFAHIIGKRQGGHQYIASGISWGRHTLPSKRKIRFENSWGENIAFPSFFMTWEEAENVIEDEGDVLVPIVL